MADITINGKPKLNAWGYQVVEDSTPVDPSSSSGGFGQITLTVPDYPNSIFDMGSTVTLSDQTLGETEGTIATLSTDETVLTVTANSLLGLLSVTATALPYTGSLGGYFAYLLGLVGITTGFQVDAAIAPLTRTNLVTNPKVAVNTTNWGGSNSGSTVTLTRNTGTGPLGFPNYYRATASGVGTLLQIAYGNGTAAQFAVQPKQQYTLSAYCRTLSVGNLAARIQWFDNTGTAISTSSGTSIAVNGVAQWLRPSATATAPANAVAAILIFRVTPTSGATANGDLLDVGAMLMEKSGTLGDYFDGSYAPVGYVGYYWSGAADASTSTCEPVRKSFPGWNANIWDQVKALCSAQQVEVTLASDSIIMRPLRQNLAQTYRDESRSLTLDTNNIAQTVSSFYYQGTQQSAGMAYPLGGLSTGPTVLQVDARQTIVSTIPLTPNSSDGTGLGASLTSISQPVASDNVPLGYSGTVSVYQIIDANNNLYPSSKWNAKGGKVTAAISPDGQSLIVTVTGCNDVSLAPYRLGIADPTQPNAAYSSLFIMGAGVFYNKQLVTFPTGNTNTQTANLAGPTIDNFAVTSPSEARSAALWAAVSAQGPTKTLAVDALGINRAGDQQNAAQMTMGQFDAIFAAGMFGDFDAQFPGDTFGQFDVWSSSQVAGEFANQAFGNVGGARILYKNAWYRIDAATITPDGISYTAIGDTTFGDFDTVWAGATFAQFDAIWAGRPYSQFPLAPLTNS